MYSFKDNVFCALALYNAGSLQDIIKIPLGRAVLFAASGPSAVSLTAFIFAHCTLTRAKAIRAPSMQTDCLITSRRGRH